MALRTEFRNFVDYAEDKLWPLFRYIDRHQTGKIDRDTLREAFERSGVTVSDARIDEFFNDVDRNKDGVITYAEWRYAALLFFFQETGLLICVFQRDFLLFLPGHSLSNLHDILSYFKIPGTVNLDGDVQINKLGGLGTAQTTCSSSLSSLFLLRYSAMAALRDLLYGILPVLATTVVVLQSAYAEADCEEQQLEWLPVPMNVAMVLSIRYYKQKLTDNTPQLGYFVAGGIAGVISRSATAPLDRLKVYLIAQSGVNKRVVRAAKEGDTLKVAGSASRTLVNAVKDLWRAGGIRSLFAGMLQIFY